MRRKSQRARYNACTYVPNLTLWVRHQPKCSGASYSKLPSLLQRRSLQYVYAIALAQTALILVKRELRLWLHAASQTALGLAQFQALESSVFGRVTGKWPNRAPGDVPGLDARSRNSYQSVLGKNCRERARSLNPVGSGPAIGSTTFHESRGSTPHNLISGGERAIRRPRSSFFVFLVASTTAASECLARQLLAIRCTRPPV